LCKKSIKIKIKIFLNKCKRKKIIGQFNSNDNTYNFKLPHKIAFIKHIYLDITTQQSEIILNNIVLFANDIKICDHLAHHYCPPNNSNYIPLYSSSILNNNGLYIGNKNITFRINCTQIGDDLKLYNINMHIFYEKTTKELIDTLNKEYEQKSKSFMDIRNKKYIK
jgi:hypothetical protein